jgi:NADPH-dependent 2,4-dienoyl-CoA reductase/sulfur reductase-like enzyme
MTCVIVGGGVAGFQAATTCRALWPEQAVTLIDAEKEVGYYRTLLPQFLVGALEEEKLFFWRGGDDPHLTVRPGLRVTSLDRGSRSLGLAGGESLSYDRLVLAHGGDPYLPDILAGPPCRGIFPLRDLTTIRRARSWIADHRKAIVVGGSLVGVKTAVYLRHAGLDVALVVRRSHPLLRALSPEAAEVVASHLKRSGIRLFANSPLEDLRITDGAVSGLKAGGAWIDGDVLFAATGTVPNLSFLEGSGLLTDGRLLVSPALQTADPRIFAAGDVAVIAAPEGEPASPNTWPQAVTQGKTAGANLYRPTPVPHRDLFWINAMELHGFPLVVLGPPVEGAEVIAYARPEEGVRRELFLVGGKPVGGSLVGDISAAGPLHALIGSGRDIGSGEVELLKPRTRSVFRFPEGSGRRQALVFALAQKP